ncbi:hypothetical protein JXQ70_06640 [bacterium]|nr:hypothetical protein [bacterium]
MHSYVISRSDLPYLPVPQATETFQPVPHQTALSICEEQLNGVGLHVRDEAITVTGSGAVMACRWIVHNGTSKGVEGFEPQVIVLNGNTRRHKLRVGFGIRAMVCLNGMFAAERQIGRKHTKYVLRDLEELVREAIHDSLGWVEEYVSYLYCLKTVTPSRQNVNDLLIASAEQNIINSSMIMKVLSIYRKPTWPDYGQGTLYTLHSAYTETLRTVSPFILPQRTIKLDRLFQELLFEGSLALN